MIATKCYNRILSAGIKELSSDIFNSLYVKIRQYLPSREILNKPDMPCIWGSSFVLLQESCLNLNERRLVRMVQR